MVDFFLSYKIGSISKSSETKLQEDEQLFG